MKIKTTAKAIRESYEPKLAVSYCGAQYLLRNHAPIAYTCGTYGWNFDVYSVNGVIICTGYRGMVGKTPNWERLNTYEREAREIQNDNTLDWEDKSKEIESLLLEWLDEETA